MAYFYISPTQQEKVNSLKISLPDGCRFDEVDIEKDAEIITNTWIYSGPSEVSQTKLKLKYCPSVVVRKENDPIGLKMSTCLGTQNHLWVLEEHGMKGIGRAIEMKLAQECIRFVKLSNENVVKRTNRPDLDSKGGHLREAPHNRLCPP